MYVSRIRISGRIFGPGNITHIVVQSAGAVEYTNCFSAYPTSFLDGEVPEMQDNSGLRSTPTLPSLSEW